MPRLSIEAVVVCDRNTYAIGSGQDLLYSLPKDMKRFKSLTTGHPVIMGSATARSIGRALPKRDNYVMTRGNEPPYEGQIAVASLQEAINGAVASAESDVRLFVIGGEEIYRLTMPYWTDLHITMVYAPPTKTPDKFFPMEEYLTFHQKEINHGLGTWIQDGPNDEIETFFYHQRLRHSRIARPSLPSHFTFGNPSL